MNPPEEVMQLKSQLEAEELSAEQRLDLVTERLNKLLSVAAVQRSSDVLTDLKSCLYRSGVLSHCVDLLAQHPARPQSDWSAAAMLATLTSSCCVGVKPGEDLEAFNSLFLPSVMENLLLLASQLLRRADCLSLLRKVMDAIAWVLKAHTHLTSQVLSSPHYEHVQMCDDVQVALLCAQMWTEICSGSSNFLSGLSDDSILLLLNEAIGQLAFSSASTVGRAYIRLILLMADHLKLHPFLLKFRGLDSLLAKDWRGRGFDQDVDQLIMLVQLDISSERHASSERMRAACVIQSAWRSYLTRRRVRSLTQAVGVLQRQYRAQKRQQQQQQEQQQWEEELKYQVCLRRQQARRKFHQKHRQLLQLLPHGQVQAYLLECEHRAAVIIQSSWRGFRERQRYKNITRSTVRPTDAEQVAARKLQAVVRRFLQKQRAAKAPALSWPWTGQKGLTDGRRVELRRHVEEYVTLHPSPGISREECERLHVEVQQSLASHLMGVAGRTMEEQKTAATLAQINTQLDLLKDAPSLSAVVQTEVPPFLSPSALIASRARDAHHARLQASRLPWWRRLCESELSDNLSLEESTEATGRLHVAD